MIRTQTREQAGGREVEQAIQTHSRLVYRVAYSVLRDPHDAEDAAQETFLRLLRYRRRLDSARNPRAFLARIAWRVALDRIRKRKRRAELSLDEAAEPVRRMRSQGRNPEEIAAATEMQELLTRVVGTLPRKLRDAFTLSTIRDMPAAEIAEVLRIPEASVRTRLFRARQILKEKVGSLLDPKQEMES